MTRHEVQQLAAIWRGLKRGGQEGAAVDQLEMLICNAALDLVLEDEVNTALEQSTKGTVDDKQRPV